MEDWYELPNKTWGAILDNVVKKNPKKVALIFGRKQVTYQELNDQVNTIAKGLIDLGVKKGDIIAIWMTNRLEWIYTQYAIYKVGAIMVPFNTRWKDTEVKYSLNQSDTSTLIGMDNFLGTIDSLEMFKSLCPEINNCEPGQLYSQAFPNLRRVIMLGGRKSKGMIDFSEVMRIGNNSTLDEKLKEFQASVDPFDIMNIMYTSGTTGFSKGGLSMHRNNMACVHTVGKRMNLNGTERFLLDLPLFGNFGSLWIGGLGFYHGCTIVMNEIFNPELSFQTIEEYKITHLFGTPTMFFMMLESPKLQVNSLKSLRGGLIGGSPVLPELMKGIINKMGAKEMLVVYGLSECGGISTTTLIDDPLDVRCNTIGIPIPNAKVSIVNPENGKELSCGEVGEIWLKDLYPGSSVGKGYYKMPDKTAETITRDGWFKTGDLGTADEKGYIRFKGRLKEMFWVGGFNVYPAEIENFLCKHPKVSDAYVIGVPDRRLGDVPMAFIILHEGESLSEEEIISFCKKSISNYKVPRYVKFVRKEDIPLTGIGKARKFMLREMAIKELGLSNNYK
jgi:fatty-acyl-CoA synthase